MNGYMFIGVDEVRWFRRVCQAVEDLGAAPLKGFTAFDGAAAVLV
jgi:hypothetical protein